MNKQARGKGFAVLVQDESCHWYIIPEEKQGEWSTWAENEDDWDVPNYAFSVGGGPERCKFRDFELR